MQPSTPFLPARRGILSSTLLAPLLLGIASLVPFISATLSPTSVICGGFNEFPCTCFGTENNSTCHSSCEHIQGGFAAGVPIHFCENQSIYGGYKTFISCSRIQASDKSLEKYLSLCYMNQVYLNRHVEKLESKYMFGVNDEILPADLATKFPSLRYISLDGGIVLKGKIPNLSDLGNKIYHLDLSNNNFDPVQSELFTYLSKYQSNIKFLNIENSGILAKKCSATPRPTCPEHASCVDTDCVMDGVYCISYACKCNDGFFKNKNGKCIVTLIKAGQITHSSFSVVVNVGQKPPSIQLRLVRFLTETNTEEVTAYSKLQVKAVPPSSNSYPTTFQSLQPGQKYGVILIDDDKQFNSVQQEEDVETICACAVSDDGDTTGKPITPLASQEQGQIVFRFTDNSYCEEGYSFSRRSTDTNDRDKAEGILTSSESYEQSVAFTQNFFYYGNQDCYEEITPKFQAADKLLESKLNVGEFYIYDISAISSSYSFGGIKKSNPATILHQVLWEASVSGIVTLSKEAGRLPVEGVKVEYQFRTAPGDDATIITDACEEDRLDPDSQWCSTMTSASGNFHIELNSIHTSLNNDDEFPLFLRFQKQTGDVSHTFLCDDETFDCSNPNESSVFLKHLDLDTPTTVIDDTTVQFQGTLTVADTNDCPIPNAEVCLKVHNTRNNIITEGACVETDQDGVYRVPAVVGTLVSPEVMYYDHNFQPTRAKSRPNNRLYKSGIKIEPGKVYEGYNLEDVTKASLVVEVAGGLCNNVLGTSTLEVTMPKCDAWGGDEISVVSRYKQAFMVPAQDVRVELKKVEDEDGNRRDEITDDMIAVKVRNIDLRELEKEDKAKNQTKANIPHGMSESETGAEVDPNSTEGKAIQHSKEQEEERGEMKKVRFQATGIDNISVLLENFNDGSPLVGLDQSTCGLGDNNAEESFYAVPTGKLINLYPTIVESFGEGIATCSKFPTGTTLMYQNKIGISDEAKRSSQEEVWFQGLKSKPDSENLVRALTTCNPFCRVPLEFDDNGSLKPQLFYSGLPNIIVPFFKSIKLILERPIQLHGKAEHTARVAVTGDVTISPGSSVALPTHKPLLALRDPPGGRSYAYYNNVRTTLHAEVENYETYAGINSEFEFVAGANVESEGCLGFAVSLCAFIASLGADGHVDVGGDIAFLTKLTDDTKEASWTTTWSYSTSDDPWLAGSNSDTFLVPNINLIFVKVATIYLNSTQCPAMKEQRKFNFDDEVKNKPAFAFISRYDVDNVELPELRNLLDQEKEKVNDATLNATQKEEAQESLLKFNASINDWETFLKDHDEISKKAKDGSLNSPNAWFDLDVEKKLQAKWEKEKDELYTSYVAQVNLANAGTKHVVKTTTREVWESDNEERLKNSWRERDFPKIHYSSLIPKEFKDSAVSLRENANLEDNINLIKFDGGGSSLEYELSTHHLEAIGNKLGSPDDNMNWNAYLGAGGEFDAKAIAVSTRVTVNVSTVGGGEYSHKRIDSTESETSFGFVLGDDDIDDVFDVEVFLDDTYGTFVFNTKAGRSKCPHEEGTDAREEPAITATARHEGVTMPDEPILFDVELQNKGVMPGTFILFEDKHDTTKLGGLNINGGSLSGPQVYEDIGSQDRVSTVVSFSRAPHAYSFPAITLFFQPQCEYTMSGPQVQLTSATLENPSGSGKLEFAEPCPRIEWSSDILNDRSFSFNIESEGELNGQSNRIPIVIRNLNPRRPLRTQERLESVNLLYRQVGSVDWNKGRLILQGSVPTDNLLDYEENGFGYINAIWSIDGFADGHYEIEARSMCKPSNGSPAAFNSYSTDGVLGAIDLTRPILFGKPQPLNNEVFLIGEAVSFEFVESVMCGGAAHYRIELTIDGLKRKFDNQETNNLLSTCQGRIISFVFDETTTSNFSSTFGRAPKDMHIKLSGVQDMQGNEMAKPVEYAYQLALQLDADQNSDSKNDGGPILFGKPQPLNNEVLLIGEAVSFEFVESVMCGGAGNYRIELTIDGLNRKFDNRETNNLLSTCQGRFISFVFDETTTSNLSSNFGTAPRAMHIKLSGVQDMQGNEMAKPVEYTYQLALQLDADQNSASKNDGGVRKFSTVNVEEDLLVVGGEERGHSQQQHARIHDIEEMKQHLTRYLNLIGGIGLVIVSMIVGLSGFVWYERRLKKREEYSVIL